jgi:aminoglycoside phosphotransferase (APT) family kinase protein
VLRGWPRHPQQWDKERLHAQLIREHTRLKPPWPYLVEPDHGLFGWPYALTGEVVGIHGVDPRLWQAAADPQRALLAEAFGRGLAALHELAMEEPGHYDPDRDDIAPLPTPFADAVLSRIESLLARCSARGPGCLDANGADWIRRIVRDNAAALTPPSPAVFVHHDFTLDNIFFARDDAGWRLDGVIDLAEGYFGDGEEDLVRTLASFGLRHRERIGDFLRGYLSVRRLRAKALERYRIYILADRLDVWIHSHERGLQVPDGLTFRAFAEPLVKLHLF